MLKMIKNIDGVYDVYRLMPGKADALDLADDDIASAHPSAN